MNIGNFKKHKMLLLGFVNVDQFDPNKQACNCWDGLTCNAYFCNPEKWGRVSGELLEIELEDYLEMITEDKAIQAMENFYPLDDPDLMREMKESQ